MDKNFVTQESGDAALTYTVPSSVPSEAPDIMRAFIRQAILHADVDHTTVNFVHKAKINDVGIVVRPEVSLQIPPRSDIAEIHAEYQKELAKQAYPSSTVQGEGVKISSLPAQEKRR